MSADRPRGLIEPPPWRSPRGAALAGLGALALAAAGVWLVGPLGAVVAGLAVAVWVVFDFPTAVGLTYVSLLAVGTPAATDRPLPLVGVNAGLAGLLGADLDTADPAALAGVLGASLGLGVVTAGLLSALPLWLAALGVLLVVGVAAYGLHRYELVALELVTEASTDGR